MAIVGRHVNLGRGLHPAIVGRGGTQFWKTTSELGSLGDHRAREEHGTEDQIKDALCYGAPAEFFNLMYGEHQAKERARRKLPDWQQKMGPVKSNWVKDPNPRRQRA